MRWPRDARAGHAPSVAAPHAPATSTATTEPPAFTAAPATVHVAYRVEVRADGGDDFASIIAATMSDSRGWARAGFVVVERPDAAYAVVLAEGPEVDALCRPYDTGGRFSCQNGPVVAINADRWRSGVAHFADIGAYRVMLVNHEMGHLLGQRHRTCPGRGPSPLMAQQSGGLGGCTANPWPLPDEIARAARHDLKLAPGYGE